MWAAVGEALGKGRIAVARRWSFDIAMGEKTVAVRLGWLETALKVPIVTALAVIPSALNL